MPGRMPKIQVAMPESILVVDDNAINLALMGDVLRPVYRVLVANCGRRALELAAASPGPDLILLDVMMPGMDGFEVLARLRENPQTSGIPVIFVTAMSDAADEQGGLTQGAVDYICKPIRPAVVMARVRTQLDAKRARDALRNRNINLEAEVTRRMHENAVIEYFTMHALTRLAQTRDNETGNHLRRTKEYVGLLARRLRNHPRFAHFLDDRAIELLEKSAPLHDIGKVGIPDHVLLKPGRHTPDERTVMRTHARLGAQAIERAETDAACPVGFLEYAKEIALHHHERWDGGGYPDGLAGDAIPIPARLMAIADVFDALVSRRPYKAGFDPREARRLIAAERGAHFDPDVTDAFLAGIADFEQIALKYADGVDVDADDSVAGYPESADAGHA